MTEHDCRTLASDLDLYLDGQLDPARREWIAAQIAGCPHCTAAVARLAGLRAQLRRAVATETTPPGLETRIRARLREPVRRSWWVQPIPLVAMAACVVVTLTAVGWLTVIRPEESRIAALLGVGASDHVHCTLERKNPPPGSLNRPLPAEHANLLAAVAQQMPEGFQLLESHYCRFRGRKFTHIVFQRNAERVSVIVLPKKAGEDFPRRALLAAMKVNGIPVYQSRVAGVETAAFETDSSLAFVVSQMDGEANLSMMARLAPAIRASIP